MSHSTVLVIGPKTEDELEKALAPFDENTEVDPYVSDTRESLIAKERERHVYAAERLEQFLADPAKYGVANPAHIRWIVRDAPQRAELSDDELWKQHVQPTYAPDLDDQDRIWSTYNPKSRWDWYAIGGRWHRNLHLKDGVEVSAHVGSPSWGNPDPNGDGGVNFVDRTSELDLDRTTPTFAVLTPDGEWHERGRMGWFGLVADEQEPDTWAPEWRALVESHADQPAFLVDVHI
jgi:hypothetical protein